MGLFSFAGLTSRKITPISIVILGTEKPTELDVVTSLQKNNLRDLTESGLYKSSVRTVGEIQG